MEHYFAGVKYRDNEMIYTETGKYAENVFRYSNHFADAEIIISQRLCPIMCI